jgi:hypothetical protein
MYEFWDAWMNPPTSNQKISLCLYIDLEQEHSNRECDNHFVLLDYTIHIH